MNGKSEAVCGKCGKEFDMENLREMKPINSLNLAKLVADGTGQLDCFIKCRECGKWSDFVIKMELTGIWRVN